MHVGVRHLDHDVIQSFCADGGAVDCCISGSHGARKEVARVQISDIESISFPNEWQSMSRSLSPLNVVQKISIFLWKSAQIVTRLTLLDEKEISRKGSFAWHKGSSWTSCSLLSQRPPWQRRRMRQRKLVSYMPLMCCTTAL